MQLLCRSTTLMVECMHVQSLPCKPLNIIVAQKTEPNVNLLKAFNIKQLRCTYLYPPHAGIPLAKSSAPSPTLLFFYRCKADDSQYSCAARFSGITTPQLVCFIFLKVVKTCNCCLHILHRSPHRGVVGRFFHLTSPMWPHPTEDVSGKNLTKNFCIHAGTLFTAESNPIDSDTAILRVSDTWSTSGVCRHSGYKNRHKHFSDWLLSFLLYHRSEGLSPFSSYTTKDGEPFAAASASPPALSASSLQHQSRSLGGGVLTVATASGGGAGDGGSSALGRRARIGYLIMLSGVEELQKTKRLLKVGHPHVMQLL